MDLTRNCDAVLLGLTATDDECDDWKLLPRAWPRTARVSAMKNSMVAAFSPVGRSYESKLITFERSPRCTKVG